MLRADTDRYPFQFFATERTVLGLEDRFRGVPRTDCFRSASTTLSFFALIASYSKNVFPRLRILAHPSFPFHFPSLTLSFPLYVLLQGLEIGDRKEPMLDATLHCQASVHTWPWVLWSVPELTFQCY